MTAQGKFLVENTWKGFAWGAVAAVGNTWFPVVVTEPPEVMPMKSRLCPEAWWEVALLRASLDQLEGGEPSRACVVWPKVDSSTDRDGA